MKLPLDQNISRRLLADIADCYPGSSHVQLLGLESASDMDLWEFALGHEYVIVTKDVDFLELHMMSGYPPKILWLNCGNCSNAEIRTRLLADTKSIFTALSDDEVGVVEID